MFQIFPSSKIHKTPLLPQAKELYSTMYLKQEKGKKSTMMKNGIGYCIYQ